MSIGEPSRSPHFRMSTDPISIASTRKLDETETSTIGPLVLTTTRPNLVSLAVKGILALQRSVFQAASSLFKSLGLSFG